MQSTSWGGERKVIRRRRGSEEEGRKEWKEGAEVRGRKAKGRGRMGRNKHLKIFIPLPWP